MTTIRNRTNAAHYRWGDGCDGWRLHEDEIIGLIEELVPAACAEVPHRHSTARQVFVILSGEAVMIVGGTAVAMSTGDALLVPAGLVHQFRNESEQPVRFLVISYPRDRWDRIDDPPPARDIVTLPSQSHDA